VGSAQEEKLNKRRKRKRGFEMRERKLSKSKSVKGKNENFKYRYHGLQRPKKALRTAMQSRDIMSKIRINAFNSISLTFVF